MALFGFLNKVPAKPITLTLAADKGEPSAIKSVDNTERIALSKLEGAYYQDPLCRIAIDTRTSMIMQAGYKLNGKEDDVKKVTEWLASIGTQGGTVQWNELLEIIFKYPQIYGNAFIERIYSDNQRKLYDLDFHDPKGIDYGKDGTGTKIIADKFGNPVGYVQTLPYQYSEEVAKALQKFDAPADVKLGSGQIFIPKEFFVQFKYGAFGEGYYPLGLIEPIYKLIVQKRRAEVGYSNALKNAGFPVWIMKVGSVENPPTEQQLKDGLDVLKLLNEGNVCTTAYYNDIKKEATNIQLPADALNYFIEQEITGLGIPSSLVYGRSNRSVSERQEFIFISSLNQYVAKNVEKINNEIIGEFCRLEKLGEVKMEWNEISVGELDALALRISRLVKSQALTPDENLEKFLRGMEGIPDKAPSAEKPGKKEAGADATKGNNPGNGAKDTPDVE